MKQQYLSKRVNRKSISTGLSDVVVFYFRGTNLTNENGTVDYCCTGFCVEILMTLADRMNFDFYIYEVPDGQWGVQVGVALGNQCLSSQSKLTCCQDTSITCSVIHVDVCIFLALSLKKRGYSCPLQIPVLIHFYHNRLK